MAVSAPTSLAIQTAHECGVALAGLVRDGRRMVAHTFTDRLGFELIALSDRHPVGMTSQRRSPSASWILFSVLYWLSA